MRGEPGRERDGNARMIRRYRIDIGSQLVAPALMCGGSERAKRFQMYCPHKTPAEKDRDVPSLSSQWLEGAAAVMASSGFRT